MNKEIQQCSLPPGILSWAYALRGFLMPCMQQFYDCTSSFRQAAVLPQPLNLTRSHSRCTKVK